MYRQLRLHSHRLLLAVASLLLAAPALAQTQMGQTFCGPTTPCDVQIGTGGITINPSATEMVILDGSSGLDTVATPPCAGGGVMLFDDIRRGVTTYQGGSDDAACSWAVELPPNLTGTTISVQYVWEAAGLVTGSNDDVCFEVDALSIGDGEDIGGTLTFGTAVAQQDTGTTAQAEARLVSDAFTVTPAGLGASEQLILRMTRDTDASSACSAADVSGDVNILAIRVSYEVDNVFSGE